MDAHARTQQFSPFPDNDTEITRLMMLHLLLQEEIASFCPNLRERDDVNTVLDVACGPGWWVFAMAQAQRDVDFVGMDRSTSFIKFARTIIHARKMENALFLVQNIYSPEEALLPGGGFDFTNMAFIADSTSQAAFPALLQQVHRLCRPGGLMRWVEMDPPGTNSEAYGRLTTLARQALLKAGLGLSTSTQTTSSAQVMEQLLRAAGFEEAHSVTHEFVIAADKGSRTHYRFFRQASVACLQMRAFLLAMEVTTIQEFEQLYRQMHVDMLSKGFHGMCVLSMVYGKRAR
jgi:ubiquinone/menaquinone biosynthesis C-methylase UbiE